MRISSANRNLGSDFGFAAGHDERQQGRAMVRQLKDRMRRISDASADFRLLAFFR